MGIPEFTATWSLETSSPAYSGGLNSIGKSEGTVIPADCPGVNCEAARDFCFASFDLDPISCGLYYGCCQGAGMTGGDFNGPQPDIPPSSNFPLTSGGVVVPPPPSMGQRGSDPCNVQQQLNRIERCACGYRGVVGAPPSWFTRSYALR